MICFRAEVLSERGSSLSSEGECFPSQCEDFPPGLELMDAGLSWARSCGVAPRQRQPKRAQAGSAHMEPTPGSWDGREGGETSAPSLQSSGLCQQGG